jgi:predicted GNAT superfamily acetyltransferase
VSDGITIRDIATQAEYAACVALQRDTWGSGFADVVPASILQVTQKVGGVTAGAFDKTGDLVGFVFGVTGVENGDLVHWSDMLAVRATARNHGIGRRLKEFQRQAVMRLGVKVIYWTFDPLVARNAHLNFNVFGTTAVKYVRDMYGQSTGSDLHRGIGTDRLIVAWPVDEKKQAELRKTSAESHQPALRIEVPADIEPMLVQDAPRAREWRKATRTAFEAALGDGYRVDGFRLDPANGRGFYLLSRA